MSGAYYRLDGSAYEDSPEDPACLQWAWDFEASEERRIGLDYIWNGITLSTVFLGLDHSFGSGPPLIFETMAFDPKTGESVLQDRYSNLDDAIAYHAYYKYRLSGWIFTARLWWKYLKDEYQYDGIEEYF